MSLITQGLTFGDIVLVSFPFTNLLETKKRPAVVISNLRYQQERPDVIIMAVTSQMRVPLGFGELQIDDWQSAGLLKPSVIKPVIATIEQSLVLQKMGSLARADILKLKNLIVLLSS